MKFDVQVNDDTIRKAASIVMRHHLDKEFLDQIEKVEKFNHTDMTSLQVRLRLEYMSPFLNMKVVPYKTFSPWSKVIGYAKGDTIFVNTRKLNLPLWDRTGNFFHEATHLLKFSHQGNRVTPYNLKTVPYLSAEIFVKYCREIYG